MSLRFSQEVAKNNQKGGRKYRLYDVCKYIIESHSYSSRLGKSELPIHKNNHRHSRWLFVMFSYNETFNLV